MTEANWSKLDVIAKREGCASWRVMLRRIATGDIQVAATKPLIGVPCATERPVILQPVDTITEKGAERHWVPIED